jgi:hypothetical protein
LHLVEWEKAVAGVHFIRPFFGLLKSINDTNTGSSQWENILVILVRDYFRRARHLGPGPGGAQVEINKEPSEGILNSKK